MHKLKANYWYSFSFTYRTGARYTPRVQAPLARADDFRLVTRSTAIGGPSWRPEHIHQDFELSYVEQGTLDFRTDNGPHGARIGECILMPAGVVNRPRLSGRITQLHLSAAMLGAAGEALGRPARLAEVARFAPSATTTRLMALIADSARQLPSGDPQLDALVDACTLSLVPRDVAATQRAPDARIRTAIDFIQGNLRNAIGVSDIAKAAGLSRFVFLRQFKAQTGCTPYRFLLDRRLDCARELLGSGDHSVLSVALELEFRDPGRFSREFRARFGLTPSQLRKK